MISVPSLQRIPAYLLDRKQGEVSDTYYRMFEAYAATKIQPQMYQGVINDQFVQNMDTDALLAYGKFYYVPKPANIPVELYRQFILTLNNIAVGGPTVGAVTSFLQLFDATASISQYTGNPIYQIDSIFWNGTSYPTPEYVLLSEDSEFTLKPTEPSQLLLLSENSFLLVTSKLLVPSLITRQFIRDCLQIILPATVRVLLNFDLMSEFHFFDNISSDNTLVWSWDESSEELLQFSLANLLLPNQGMSYIAGIGTFSSLGYDSAAMVVQNNYVYTALINNTSFILSNTPALLLSNYSYMETVGDKIVYYNNQYNVMLVDPINKIEIPLPVYDGINAAFKNIILVKKTNNNNGFWIITSDLNSTFGITVFTKDGVQVNKTTYSPTPSNFSAYSQIFVKNLFCPINLKKATSFNPMTLQHISIDITNASYQIPAIFTIGVNWGSFSPALVSSMGTAYDSRDYLLLVQATGGTVHLGSFDFNHNFLDLGSLPDVSFSTVQIFVEGGTVYGIVLTNKQIVRIDGVFTNILTSELYSINYPQTSTTSLNTILTNTYDTILS